MSHVGSYIQTVREKKVNTIDMEQGIDIWISQHLVTPVVVPMLGFIPPHDFV
jgi:hypothetical protein